MPEINSFRLKKRRLNIFGLGIQIFPFRVWVFDWEFFWTDSLTLFLKKNLDLSPFLTIMGSLPSYNYASLAQTSKKQFWRENNWKKSFFEKCRKSEIFLYSLRKSELFQSECREGKGWVNIGSHKRSRRNFKTKNFKKLTWHSEFRLIFQKSWWITEKWGLLERNPKNERE